MAERFDRMALARAVQEARMQLAAQPQRWPTSYGTPEADARAMAPETFDATRARADGGRVGYADGGVPDGFNPAEFSAFKTDVAKPAPAAATTAAPAGGDFDPAAFEAFKTGPPPSKSADLPDVGAPLIGNGGQLSGGTDWGNRTADSAAATANTAIRNIPHSGAEFVKNTIQPIIHPINTLGSLKDLGLGVLEKTGVVPGSEHEKYADAVGRFFADRYGGIENVRKTLETDPVGMAGDLSMLLTGGGSAAARLPGALGRAGEVAADVGRVVDPLRAAAPVAQAVGSGIGHVASELAGVTTGVGGQPLRMATHAGLEGGPAAQAFRENLSGAAPLENAVNDARTALAEIRRERGDTYRAQMAAVNADNTVLDFNRIDQGIARAEGIKTYSGRSGTGPTQNLNPATQGVRQQMTDSIDNWRHLDPAEFHTPEGIDALKQQLGDIRDATEHHTPARVAADRIYNAVRQTIVDQVPEYARVMHGYEQASRQIREIETTLSLKPNANIDASLRKLQSTLRDNVNTSFGRRTELANFLVNAGAPHLMERLAGQALHSWAPRGLARVATMETLPAIAGAVGAGAPGAAAAAAAMLPTMSPRLMGEVAYGVGAARRRVGPLLSAAARPARQIGQVSGSEPFAAASNPYAPR